MSQVRKVPMRQCIGCREMKSKKEMIRILKTTEDEIVIDATGKKNGRTLVTAGLAIVAFLLSYLAVSALICGE